MNVALGDAGVVLALVSSLLGALTMVVGLTSGRRHLLRVGRTYVWLVLGGSVVAFVAMERALITRDFSVRYVAEHGSTQTPPLFNVATLWSSLEGSILLWSVVLAGYLAAVTLRFRSKATDPVVGWASVTMFAVAAFFFALMLGPADPFVEVTTAAGYDGPGPNPLLQNHVLVAFHPPMLYLGYVGFTVPFAFAVGSLVTGRVTEDWLEATRRWTLFSWGFLSAGIVLGAWWSYEVLGWGGYWAWDPVENASFLPWLTATAFIHSVIVQERRAMLRVWNIALVAATFALTILGTFLTRSGVIDSVHAFSQSSIGPALLALFATVVVVTVGLIAWRGDALRTPGRIDSPLSREAAFLGNNLLFGSFAAVVLLGTVFPLVVEAVNDERISVGTPYFSRMTMPVGLAILFLMAVAPVLPWGRTTGETLMRRLEWSLWSGIGALVLAVGVGARGLVTVLAFGLAGFAAGSALRHLTLSVRRNGVRGLLGRSNGGMVVHLGLLVLAVAFAASTSYLRQSEYTLVPGESVSFAGHDLTYVGGDLVDTPRTFEQRALIEVDGSGPYAPALTRFNAAGQTVGTPSVRSTPLDDVHLSLLTAPDADSGEVRIRVTVRPLVMWLWVGGGVMVVGTAMALVPPPRRRLGAAPTDVVDRTRSAEEERV